MGLPANRWLPPQWSKCRCVLTTMSIPAKSNCCSLRGLSWGSMSATAGCSCVMPVSTRMRAPECSITCTYTGIHWPLPTSKSATWTGTTTGGGTGRLSPALLTLAARLGEDHPSRDRLEDACHVDVDFLVDQVRAALDDD